MRDCRAVRRERMMNADQGGREIEAGRMASSLERSKIDMAIYGHVPAV